MRPPAYRPDIDGLRAVAVLSVLVFHLNRPWLPGGFFGVDIFFVISGYLITSIILRDCEGGRFSFARFYQRRIARLLPAFFAVAVATLTGAAFIYSPRDLASTGATLSAAAASVANLKFLLQGNYFVLSPDSQPFLHCWSLSLEEQFYLLFPALLLLCRKTRVLAALALASFAIYLVLDRVRPEWAFYLLPARAWELLAGSVLATIDPRRPPVRIPGGLLLIAVAVLSGRFAPLAVIGAASLLWSGGPRALSWRPMALIGRMSYSLYLWHWPVFSLVDYKLYWQPAIVRLVLKLAITFGGAAACYLWVERPGRALLNQPMKQRLAFGALAASFATLIPLGLAVRNVTYVNADARAVRSGGRRFNAGAHNGSMMLMGDSNGSMYGRLATEIARERDLRLDVISVEAGDPLPNTLLWADSLATVRRERPDVLLLVCNWNKLDGNPDRLKLALSELKPWAHNIVLLTQPPELPDNATREAIREGYRPPFHEEAAERAARQEHNDFVKAAQGGNVRVVDIEPLFSREAGEVRFVDRQWNQLYQDRNHLSAAGAELVKPALLKALNGLTASR